jgi:hypothetical protein
VSGLNRKNGYEVNAVQAEAKHTSGKAKAHAPKLELNAALEVRQQHGGFWR